MRPIADVSRALKLGAFIIALCLWDNGATAATAHQGSIEVKGLTRTFTFYLPDGFSPSRRYPIVMLLHGGMANGERIEQQTGLGSHVDRGGFIAVLPDAGGEQWNDGRETTRSGRDDVAFLVAVVREMVMSRRGDPARVFVGGASAGGMMTQRLACEATTVFAAYAVAVANLPSALAATCRPARRTPIVFFESTTDPIMPWGGGEVRHGRFRGVGGRVLSTPETIGFWSRVDGCGRAQTRDIPNRVNDGTHVRVMNFGRCGLVLYEIQGGGHTWPGGRTPGGAFVRWIVGNTTHAIDATSIMLDFFRRHGL